MYKFKNVVGGRQMLFITGGGPINPDCQDVIRTMLGCPLIQGYALTETAAAGMNGRADPCACMRRSGFARNDSRNARLVASIEA